MTAETVPVAAGNPSMDYPEHARTYGAFVTLLKWAVIHIVVLLILMAYFLL